MNRVNLFLTVFESCRPYHKLVGGKDAGESIEVRGKTAVDCEIDSRNYCDLKELLLALPANL